MKKIKDKKIIILIIIITFLILVNLIMKLASNDNDEIVTPQEVEAKENEAMISELSEEGEYDRVEQYLSKFIGEIEKGNFNKAYDLLYKEFKNNYFSTQSSFENYCKEYFPDMIDVQVSNIERINNIYVLETSINDLINGKKDEGNINMFFVIRENALNDFELSFSVNSAIDAKNT